VNSYSKNNKPKRPEDVAQVVEQLPSKHKILSSTPRKRKKKKEDEASTSPSI
jgi:hypothetical protein